MTDSCATCRHHRKEMKPATAEMGMDTIVSLSDEDVPTYFCRVASPEKEIGLLPILCESFAIPRRSSRLEELDRLLAQRTRDKNDD